ncbi:MAG: DsrE family protein [Cellvibrionaceae bacterium]|nr:DsrE family protein [Cellvibrionaceae bacterium]
MHLQPVAVAPPFPYSLGRLRPLLWRLLFCVFLSHAAVAQVVAQNVSPPVEGPLSPASSGYLARIYNDSPEEVAEALQRAEAFYQQGDFPEESNPIAIVLHGPEVEIFFKEKYDQYKKIVDLAAKLSAFGVVDVRVCETQTGIMGRQRSSLHSFIGTVPFGPTEIQRLLDQQNYVYF